MAGISYRTHTYCSKCVEHFPKKDYPDIIWCPNNCKTRVRYNAKSVLSKRKKHRFTRIDSSSNPRQGTEPQHYIIKKQSGSMKSKDEPLTNQDVPDLFALTMVKEQLEILEKNFANSISATTFGKLCETNSEIVKALHKKIDVASVIADVIKHQDRLLPEISKIVEKRRKEREQKSRHEL